MGTALKVGLGFLHFRSGWVHQGQGRPWRQASTGAKLIEFRGMGLGRHPPHEQPWMCTPVQVRHGQPTGWAWWRAMRPAGGFGRREGRALVALEDTWLATTAAGRTVRVWAATSILRCSAASSASMVSKPADGGLVVVVRTVVVVTGRTVVVVVRGRTVVRGRAVVVVNGRTVDVVRGGKATRVGARVVVVVVFPFASMTSRTIRAATAATSRTVPEEGEGAASDWKRSIM